MIIKKYGLHFCFFIVILISFGDLSAMHEDSPEHSDLNQSNTFWSSSHVRASSLLQFVSQISPELWQQVYPIILFTAILIVRHKFFPNKNLEDLRLLIRLCNNLP